MANTTLNIIATGTNVTAQRRGDTIDVLIDNETVEQSGADAAAAAIAANAAATEADLQADRAQAVADSAPELLSARDEAVAARDAVKPLQGLGAPDPSLGIEGSVYYDTSNVANVIMYGPKTSAGWGIGRSLRGPAGTADNTYTDLAAFKASDIGKLNASLVDIPNIVPSRFYWTQGNFTGLDNDRTIIKADSTALSVGAWVQAMELLTPDRFGAVAGTSGNAATNTAAFKLAIAAAFAQKVPLSLQGKYWKLDAKDQPSGGANFAKQGMVIKGGGATLKYEGAGICFQLDTGGANGQFLEEMCVDDLLIIGNVNATDGFYCRGIVRSVFRNIEVRDVSKKAHHILHGVSNHYDSLRYSPRTFATPTNPAVVHAEHGLYISNNGAGYYTANCVFTNPVMEDFNGIGCALADASGNMLMGGTFEACATGVIIGATSRDNTIAKNWFEANTSTDAVVYGNGTCFWGNRFVSTPTNPNIQIENGAGNTSFSGGGYIRSVRIAPNAIGTSFHQVGVDQNLSGTIGFQGTGKYSRIGVSKIDGSGNAVGMYSDILGGVGTWTPVLTATSGSFSLNAGLTEGRYQRVGNVVFAQCYIYVDSVSSPTGTLSIAGLPFVSQFRQPATVHATQLNASATDPIQARVDNSGASIFLTKLIAGAATAMAADVKADSTFSVSLTYLAVE